MRTVHAATVQQIRRLLKKSKIIVSFEAQILQTVTFPLQGNEMLGWKEHSTETLGSRS